MRSSQKNKLNAFNYVMRNLRGKKERTLLTISGIAVCVTLFVLFNSLGVGLDDYISDSASSKNISRYEGMAELLDGWLKILNSILIIILAVAVANTMLISVSERQHEFGTLKALGFTSRQIRNLVLFEAMLITSIAFIIGSALGISFSFICDILFQRAVDSGSGLGWFFAPAKITFGSLLYAAFISIVIGTFAALYPAVRAAALKPAEALRYE